MSCLALNTTLWMSVQNHSIAQNQQLPPLQPSFHPPPTEVGLRAPGPVMGSWPFSSGHYRRWGDKADLSCSRKDARIDIHQQVSHCPSHGLFLLSSGDGKKGSSAYTSPSLHGNSAAVPSSRAVRPSTSEYLCWEVCTNTRVRSQAHRGAKQRYVLSAVPKWVLVTGKCCRNQIVGTLGDEAAACPVRAGSPHLHLPHWTSLCPCRIAASTVSHGDVSGFLAGLQSSVQL